ncbi:MAG TPA: glycosyltransferase 87 family protein, partial [Gemmataceae bacterium]|nr:glycosyltransferase 87 family protein [Gemmataceae bacterium]
PLAALFLLALPLSHPSLHNGQANTLVFGLMLWGAAGAADGRWSAAAVLIAGAALFKGYPLAFGILLALAAPVRLGLPLVAAIATGFALPYAFQSPAYVTEQYRDWAANLSHDDRTGFPLFMGYQDFHMLLRVIGVNVPHGPYRLVQAAVGAAAAAVIGWQLWRGIDRQRVVMNALALGLCWMTLFGPSTESSTFILLAPMMAREVLDRAGRPRWSWAAALAGSALFVLSVVVFAFPHTIHRPVIALGVQPLAGLLLSVAVVARVLATRRAEEETGVTAAQLCQAA